MDYSAITQDPEHPSGSSPWDSPLPRPDGAFSSALAAGPAAYDDERPASQQSGFRARSESGNSRQGQEGDQGEGLAPGTPVQGQGQTEEQQRIQYQQSQANPNAQLPARYHTGARQAQAQTQGQAQTQTQRNGPAHKLQAKITGLERIGKKELILRFDVQTNIPDFRTTQYRDIRRTHAEFTKLAEHLVSNNPESLVPAVPPPLTAAGAGTEEDEFRIKASMQRWLNVVCSNEHLMHDAEMVLFVESDFGYSPLVRMRPPATGVRRKVLKQFAPPPDDTPELQDARPVVKAFYLGTMEAGQKLGRVVKAKRALSLAESDLGVKLGSMHAQESHAGLAHAYRKLGRVIQTVGDFRAAQGTGEATTLEDPLNYHSNDAFIVKETLTNRHILLRELQHAETTAKNRRGAAERLRRSTSVRPDRVDEALAAVGEAERTLAALAGKTAGVTGSLVQEKRRWFARTSGDLLLSIKEYTLRQIEAERRTLATLESARPDVRAIDASGGLSRLGREGHPAVRRANVGSSQGPKGDAWSGAPRSQESLTRSASLSSAFSPVAQVGVGVGEEVSAAAVVAPGLPVPGDEDEDRVDARNAASRLSGSTF